MGRLFWKFFLCIWLAQLVAMAGIGASVWFKHRAQNERLGDVDGGPAAAFLVGSAAATLQYGGTAALRDLLAAQQHLAVYAVDEQQHELLGRSVAQPTLQQAYSLLAEGEHGQVVRQSAADGHRYTLFVPLTTTALLHRHGHHPGMEPPPPMDDASPMLGHPPPPGGHMPPGAMHFPYDDPFLPVLPMLAAIAASLLSAAMLAWYFAMPIRHLRRAFAAAANGNLEVRVGVAIGKRRDELADLGRAFDHMADQLRALVEGQRRLLHDVSHELRSPLARLQAAIGLVRQQPDKLIPSLARIERESGRMDSLVGELLTLSRLEAGVMGDLDEEVNLGEIVADVVADARFEAENLGRRVDFIGDCQVDICGRAELLHRAIDNVIRNAVKHTGDNGWVMVTAEHDAEGVRLVIVDQGPGVPEAELTAIFEPFFRSETSPGASGHGLGLTIARRVIEAHHGSIVARNGVSRGLAVEIRLPLTPGRS